MHATSQMNLKLINSFTYNYTGCKLIYLVRKQVSGFLQNRCGVGEERQDGEIVLKAEGTSGGVLVMFIILFVVMVSWVSNCVKLQKLYNLRICVLLGSMLS